MRAMRSAWVSASWQHDNRSLSTLRFVMHGTHTQAAGTYHIVRVRKACGKGAFCSVDGVSQARRLFP